MSHHALRGRFGAGLIVVGVLLSTVGLSLQAHAAPPETVTFCHFSGLEGSDKSKTMVLPIQAVFGNGGHFNENGTARAGHENDHLGPCVGDSTTSSEALTSTTMSGETTSTSQSTTSSTESDVTTSTASNDTTTPSIDTTSTTAAAGDSAPAEMTTTTVSDPTTSTPAPDGDVDAPSGSSPTPPPNVELPEVVPTEETPTPSTPNIDTLPFTGPSLGLIVPGVLLVAVGTLAVFLSSGFGSAVGNHVAEDSARLGLGLRRGRHER